MDRVIGIDYGDSRIGIALSDPFGWGASPLCVVDGKQGLKKAVSEIISLVDKNSATKIVIGYPLNMNGTAGPRIQRTERFIEEFSAMRPDVEVIKWDERLTTVAADRTMRELGISQRQKGVSDKLAAAFILQGYLDSIKNK
ncbi:MAG: Holliday junction resolvase RuvX [Clostridia bacterium]|nr:Holliday junction resolvase RuvX [Clostridia bacterium]